MSAEQVAPERNTYTKVCMNDIFDPETEQEYGFYDGVIKSRNILYNGQRYSFMFLRTQAECTNLLYRRSGWVDITDQWFDFLDKKNEEKEDTIVVEKPIKRKRGRPRKKAK